MDEIYIVYDGKVETAKVDKITKKYVWIKGTAAFGFSTMVPKESACFSKKEAVEREMNFANKSVQEILAKLNTAELRLLKAKSLTVELMDT